MLITAIYIGACILSKDVTLNIGFLIGAVILDMIFGSPIVVIKQKRK